MEPLTIETFNPDMIKAINSEQKRAGEINYISVKFSYDGGKIPPLRIDGKFRFSCRLWHGSRGVILKNRKNLNKLLVFEALYL